MTDIKELSARRTLTFPADINGLHGGETYPFTPVDGYGMALIHSTPNELVPKIKASYEVAAFCLGLPFDEVFGTKDKRGFSEAEIMFVLEEAQKKVRDVEASASPNSEPAGENAAVAAG